MTLIPVETLAITDVPLAYRTDSVEVLRKRLLERKFTYVSDIPVLEPLQRPRKVRDLNQRDYFSGAGRDLPHDRRQARSAIPGNDDSGHARCVCRSQASAQIVRILNSIEHQQQRRTVVLVEQIVERTLAQDAHRFDVQADALMTFRRRQFVELPTVARFRRQAHCLRKLEYFRDARIIASLLHDQA